MKFFSIFFILAASLFMIARACDDCSPEFIEVKEQLEVVIESCNKISNSKAESLTVDVQVLVEAFYDVRAKVESYTEILTEIEVDVLITTLGDVHIALQACIDTIIELKGIMVALGLDITIIEQSVSDLWIYINLSFDEMIEICPNESHKKVTPPCDTMRKNMKDCCNQYDQTCGNCNDYSTDCSSNQRKKK